MTFSIVTSMLVLVCPISDRADQPPHVVIERTKGRPLASGRVSVFAAVVYLILQYVVGVLIYLPYNDVAFWVAIAQLLPL